MGEMKRLWTILETRVKDSTLYEDLATSYDRDLKVSCMYTRTVHVHFVVVLA